MHRVRHHECSKRVVDLNPSSLSHQPRSYSFTGSSKKTYWNCQLLGPVRCRLNLSAPGHWQNIINYMCSYIYMWYVKVHLHWSVHHRWPTHLYITLFVTAIKFIYHALCLQNYHFIKDTCTFTRLRWSGYEDTPIVLPVSYSYIVHNGINDCKGTYTSNTYQLLDDATCEEAADSTSILSFARPLHEKKCYFWCTDEW